MCGIFGSNDIKTFRELCTKNSERGNFVRSVTMLFPGGMKNDVRVKTKYDQDFDMNIEQNCFCIYYLGHVQSPTSNVREFNTETSHPFNLKNKYIAHNGVLSNHEELIQEYNLDIECKVDSDMILPLIEKIGFNDAISALQGTFGCWYYNANTACLRIFRSGSTLFNNGGDFSSSQVSDEYTQIDEGNILVYNFTSNTFNAVDKFELNMPAFFL
jgi:glutamine phosphoribosylpyrophosphate amidotransferase